MMIVVTFFMSLGTNWAADYRWQADLSRVAPALTDCTARNSREEVVA